MANRIRKLIAMAMTICMMISMVPVQALAEGTAEDFTLENVEGTMTVEGNTVTVEFTPAGKSDGETEWESELTQGETIKTEVTDVTVTEEEDGDTSTVTEIVTIENEGTLDNGTEIAGEETFTEITETSGSEESETVTVKTVLEGEESASKENMDITPEDIDLPKVEVTINPDVDDETEEPDGETGDETGDPEEDETSKDETDEKPLEEGTTVETTTTTTEPVVNEDGNTEVTVKVTEVTTEVKGDVQTGEDDPEYDYTVTETTINREVTVEASDIVTEAEHVSDTGLEGIKAETYEGKKSNADLGTSHVDINGYTPSSSGYFHKYEDKDSEGNVIETTWYPIVQRTQEEYDILPETIKAEYSFDEESGQWKPNSSNQFPVIDNGVSWDFVLGTVVENSAAATIKIRQLDSDSSSASDASMITLFDKAGNIINTYCIDNQTPTYYNTKYTIENLDEVEYFTGTEEEQKDAKAHVRAVVVNGYWGTESGTGSLAQLKESLRAALEDGADFSFSFKSRNINVASNPSFEGYANQEYTFDGSTEEGRQALLAMIDSITEGDALTATQSAVWSFGRVKDQFDGFEPYTYYAGTAIYATGEENVAAHARIELIRTFLTSDYLKEQTAADVEKQGTTVIDEDSFLTDEGITLIVGDKVQEVKDVTLENNNYDDDDDNDVYEVDLSFTMVIEPSTARGDDLIVMLIDANGNVVRKARLAGNGENDGDEFSTITKNGNTYTFEGLQLVENSDITFDLNLEGIQYLEQGVYVYKATAGYDARQTLVGMAEGEHNVNVSSEFTVNFEVTEDKSVVATHHWRKTNDPTKTPTEKVDEPDPEVRYRVARGVGQLVTIIDEEVPLAEVPQTGDNSVMWFALIMLSGCGLWILKRTDKKCKA